MALGVDPGSGSIRIARGDPGDPTVTDTAAVSLSVDQAALERADAGGRVSAEHEGRAVLAGNDALEVAAAREGTPVPLFPDGTIGDETAEIAFGELCASLLSDAGETRVGYTTPGRIIGAEAASERHRTVLRRTLEGLAGAVTPVQRGFAVIYDQLEEDNHTGLGICLGEDTTSVCLAYYGVPVMAFSVPRGGRWIAAQAAGRTGHDPEQMRSVLEDVVLDPDATDDVTDAIATAYDELAMALVGAISEEADAGDIREGLAVPVAVAGEWAIEGVEYLLGGRFDGAALPFSITGVRRPERPAESPAVGALAIATAGVEADDIVTWPGTDGEPAEEPDIPADGPDPGRSDAAVEKLFARLADRDEEIQTLEEDLATLAADVDERLTGLAAELQGAPAAETVDRLEETLAAVRESVETLEDRAGAIEGNLEALATDREADGERLADLEDTATTLGESVEAAVDGLEATDGRLAAVEEGVTGIDERVTQVEDRLAAIEEELSTIEDDRESALAAVREDLEGTAAELRSDLEAVGERCESMESDIDAVSTTATELRSDLEAVGERCESMEGDIESVSTTAAELRSDLEAVGERCESMESDIEAVSSTAASLSDRIETATADHASLAGAVDGLEERLERELDGLEGRLEDHEGTRTAIEDLRSEVGDLRSETETLSADVEGLATESGTGRWTIGLVAAAAAAGGAAVGAVLTLVGLGAFGVGGLAVGVGEGWLLVGVAPTVRATAHAYPPGFPTRRHGTGRGRARPAGTAGRRSERVRGRDGRR